LLERPFYPEIAGVLALSVGGANLSVRREYRKIIL